MKAFFLITLLGLATVNSEAGTAEAVLRGAPSISGGGNSVSMAVSSNGRHVAFLSHANNLVTNDNLSPWMDLFVRDLDEGITRLISVDASGTGGGNDDSSSPAITDDGAWVAYVSAAGNLVPDDTNGVTDIFLRDITLESTVLVSHAFGGANAASSNPSLLEDGRYVVYESKASNLVSNDVNGTQDIFVYDRSSRSNRLVSSALSFEYPLTRKVGPAHSATATSDGRFFAFVTGVTNYVSNTGAPISYGEIYFRDMQAAPTHWVSSGVASNFVSGVPYACYNPNISGNGESVVFKAATSNSPVHLYRRRNLVGLGYYPELISTDASTQGVAQISFDGRVVAYEAIDGIRVWDGSTGSNRLVMANLAETPSRTCFQPSISPDGNTISFLVSSDGVVTFYRHDYLNDLTEVAVKDSNGSPVTFGDSPTPILTSDASRVIFDSVDDSLVSGDANRASDVFAYSVDSGAVELVSLCATGRASLTPPVASFRSPTSLSPIGRVAAVTTADWTAVDTNRFLDLYVRDAAAGTQDWIGQTGAYSSQPVFSADGRYVAFLSVPFRVVSPFFGEENANVWRRNLETGETILVATNVVWNRSSSSLAISPHGNLVAFVSRISGPIGNGIPNVFIRDISSGTVVPASVASDASSPAGFVLGLDVSSEPQFSPDGRWLLFSSAARNLATNSAAGSGLYARDLVNSRTLYISPLAFPNDRRSVSVSADSRFVACIDTAGQSVARVVMFDLLSGNTVRVTNSVDARSVSVSAEGRWMTFDGRPTFGQNYGVYVRDTLSYTTEFVSSPIGDTNLITGNASQPQISHNGRYVVFASDATNLVSGDANGFKDIFIRDRWRNVTMLASINRSGTGSGNGVSLLPVLAADGRTLLFQSFASDLIEGDYNETADVFILRLSGVDSDGDGLDDDWEVAYFGNLARDGKGDFDGDGTTDEDEHRLGTDPTNAGSVFHVMKLTREDGAGTKLLWNANPGRVYRVEFKDDISSPDWNATPEAVTAAGTTATWTENSMESSPHRFYRVVLVP